MIKKQKLKELEYSLELAKLEFEKQRLIIAKAHRDLGDFLLANQELLNTINKVRDES